MQETSKEKQVAKRQEAGLPSNDLFEADAKKGFENVDQESIALPILKLLQNGSAEAQRKHANYVEGADPGMFFNTVTRELYDGEKGIHVIPCHYRLEYQEWADFGTGSGRPENIFPGDSDILSKTTKDAMNRDRLPNGNYLENTANHFVILMGKSPSTALISMKATQLKISRKWNSLMMGLKLQGKNGLFTPPTYSHIYNLKTVQMSNDKGTWFGWDVSKVGPVSDKNVYAIAKGFAEKNSKGLVKVKHGSDEEQKKTSFNL